MNDLPPYIHTNNNIEVSVILNILWCHNLIRNTESNNYTMVIEVSFSASRYVYFYKWCIRQYQHKGAYVKESKFKPRSDLKVDSI